MIGAGVGDKRKAARALVSEREAPGVLGEAECPAGGGRKVERRERLSKSRALPRSGFHFPPGATFEGNCPLNNRRLLKMRSQLEMPDGSAGHPLAHTSEGRGLRSKRSLLTAFHIKP